MKHYKLSEIAERYRRNQTVCAAALIATLYFNVSIKNVTGQGIELEGLSQSALIIILLAVLIYQSSNYLALLFEALLNAWNSRGAQRAVWIQEHRILNSDQARHVTLSDPRNEQMLQDAFLKQKQKNHRPETIVAGVRVFAFDVILPIALTVVASWWSLAWLTTADPNVQTTYITTDGDTIRAGDERIRIIGIDAPELGKRARCVAEQKAAEKARDFLSTALASGPVTITRQGEDRYGRTLAYVFVNGRDIADTMIDLDLGRPYMGGRRDGWCETAPSANN